MPEASRGIDVPSSRGGLDSRRTFLWSTLLGGAAVVALNIDKILKTSESREAQNAKPFEEVGPDECLVGQRLLFAVPKTDQHEAATVELEVIEIDNGDRIVVRVGDKAFEAPARVTIFKVASLMKSVRRNGDRLVLSKYGLEGTALAADIAEAAYQISLLPAQDGTAKARVKGSFKLPFKDPQDNASGTVDLRRRTDHDRPLI